MRNANHVPGAANAATLTALVQVRSNVGSNTLHVAWKKKTGNLGSPSV